MADLSKIKLNGEVYNLKDSSIPSWAKNSTKPTYTAAEVGATTTSEVNSLITSAISGINSFNVQIVSNLPTSNIDTHTIYFVSKTGSLNDGYNEYMYINNTWEKIGSTDIEWNTY